MDYFSYVKKIKKFPIQSSFLFSNITSMFILFIFMIDNKVCIIGLGDFLHWNFIGILIRNTTDTSINIHTTNAEYCWRYELLYLDCMFSFYSVNYE